MSPICKHPKNIKQLCLPHLKEAICWRRHRAQHFRGDSKPTCQCICLWCVGWTLNFGWYIYWPLAYSTSLHWCNICCNILVLMGLHISVKIYQTLVPWSLQHAETQPWYKVTMATTSWSKPSRSSQKKGRGTHLVWSNASGILQLYSTHLQWLTGFIVLQLFDFTRFISLF